VTSGPRTWLIFTRFPLRLASHIPMSHIMQYRAFSIKLKYLFTRPILLCTVRRRRCLRRRRRVNDHLHERVLHRHEGDLQHIAHRHPRDLAKCLQELEQRPRSRPAAQPSSSPRATRAPRRVHRARVEPERVAQEAPSKTRPVSAAKDSWVIQLSGMHPRSWGARVVQHAATATSAGW
jgi:hypothetical protein